PAWATASVITASLAVTEYAVLSTYTVLIAYDVRNSSAPLVEGGASWRSAARPVTRRPARRPLQAAVRPARAAQRSAEVVGMSPQARLSGSASAARPAGRTPP